jgi:hypothetical protein
VTGITRRDLLGLTAKAAAGAFVLSFPLSLYASPWAERAAAQTLPNVQATFTALVEAVTTVGDEATAAWIIAEFDTALPPLPGPSTSSAVAAVLDAYTVQGGHHLSFAGADPEQRRAVLEAMVKDDSPDIRQIANQVIPFASFAYWSDASLGEPAQRAGSGWRSGRKPAGQGRRTATTIATGTAHLRASRRTDG